MHVYADKQTIILNVIIVFQNKSTVLLGHKEKEILIEN